MQVKTEGDHLAPVPLVAIFTTLFGTFIIRATRFTAKWPLSLFLFASRLYTMNGYY